MRKTRAKVSAASAYRAAVDQVPAAAKARAASAKVTDATLRFDNHREPFGMLDKLPAKQRAQVQQLATNNDAGDIEKLVDDDDWNSMELVDVVEIATNKVTHQLYTWPYGSGRVFANNATTEVAAIIQHQYQATAGDLDFRKALAAAYAAAPLRELIDFRLDWEPPPAALDYEAARKQLWKLLPASQEGMRLFDSFSANEQATILAFIPAVPADANPSLTQFGLPSVSVLPRWAGLAPSGVQEERAGKWPAWKWLVAAARELVTAEAAIKAIIGALTQTEVVDLALAVGTDDDYLVFRDNGLSRLGESHATAHGLRALRLLGSLVDAAGDGAAGELARRARTHESTFHLAAIATWAVAARARRRKEAFPADLLDLATDSSTVGYGFQIAACPAYRDIIETMAPAQRGEFADAMNHGFEVRNNTDKTKPFGPEKRTPVLRGRWWYADLLPAEPTAKAMIEAIASWNRDKVPREDVLDAIAAVGAACIPHLDRALAAKEPAAQHALLAAARKRLASQSGRRSS